MSVKFITQAWDTECGSAAQKLVLVALADHADIDGYCFPSTGRVAERTGISDRQVRRHIDALTEEGVISKVTRRRRKDGTLGTWLYRINQRTSVTCGGEPADISDQPYRTSVTGSPPDISVLAEPSCSEPSGEPSLFVAPAEATDVVPNDNFDTWYNQWPKKHGKAKAKARWKKMSYVERHAALAALPAWIEYADVHPQGNTFVPHASTYLNQSRWEEEPPPIAVRQRANTVNTRSEDARNNFLARHSEPTLPALPGQTPKGIE